ncbi:c-type cytochrome [Consotaella salsifontis]|uniref:Cytochrome c556 n=1 Tax=Consotaella salsifontis TaxID=1365950 RepID=A0A1T4NNB5_9HYPH|nr:cytochrome c [Consotaella salsifontis]SJZ80714.1 Cytochrome c556 [Consotaella salsifontis]
MFHLPRPSNRTIALALAAAVATCGVAYAQNEAVIKERQELMKHNGAAAKAASGFIRGTTPYDAAKGMEILTTLQDTAEKFGTLFPEDSKTGGDTEAAPAIWEKPDEFKAALAKYKADTDKAVAAAPQDVDSFKVAFGMVASNCKSCHEEFRIDK